MKKYSIAFLGVLIALGGFMTLPEIIGQSVISSENTSAMVTVSYANTNIACTAYLNQYLFPAGYVSGNGELNGAQNIPGEVVKLQKFLNKTTGSNAFTGTLTSPNLPVTGFYGPQTTQAVKSFQHYFWPVVLQPWQPYGLTDSQMQTGTGLVYRTTKRWINMLNCPGTKIALPTFEGYNKVK